MPKFPPMSKILKAIGIVWALIGAANVFRMFERLGSGHATLEAFGLIFNFILFIAPGLVLAGLGEVLKSKAH